MADYPPAFIPLAAINILFFYMSRKLRKFRIGGIYHIINRGTEGRDIFLKNQDYSRFILALEFFNSDKDIDLWRLIGRPAGGGSDLPHLCGGSDPTLAELSLAKKLENQRKEIYKPMVEIMGFALMPNHYHLILREIVLGGISSFMQKLGGYSTYFNKQNSRSGSLFQSRYKCVEVKNDAQLFAIFTYVHTNPVELIEPMWKQRRVKNFNEAKNFLENYRYSSYRDYIGIPTFSNVINKKFFSEFFGGEDGCKRKVEDWIKFKAENYIEDNKLNPKDFE